MNNKYKIGDNVKIINYGHLIDYMEGENILRGDLRRDIIGKEGVVMNVGNSKGQPKYSIDGIIGKSAWFNEDQLEINFMRDYASKIDNRMFDFKAFYDWIAKELPNNCRLVEAGIADAASAVYLTEAILNLGKTIDKFYWVDNFSYGKYEQLKVVYQHIIKAGIGDYVEIIPTDSIKASKMFNGDSLDFVFLDSSHQYKPTLKEIKAWYSTLKDGSILSGHDYDSAENPGVRQAVDELLPTTIKRETIDDKVNDHYQEFAPEQLLHTFTTEKNLGVWYVRKRHYFKP